MSKAKWCVYLFTPMLVAAQTAYSVSPSSVSFGSKTVGMVAGGPTITVTNTGKTSITITSISVTPSEFQLASGVAPVTLSPGAATHYSNKFAPDGVKTFSGSLTLTLTKGSPIVVPLTGTGTATSAVASLSVTSVDFGSVPIGTSSAPQTVTITNTGTSSVAVTAVTTFQPFSIAGFISKTTISPGKSLPLQVSYFGNALGSATGFLTIVYDAVAAQGVSLRATATPNPVLASTSFPTLPPATQGASYLIAFAANGGTPPYSWSLAPGSTLPASVVLSSSGVLSGTIAGNLGVGSYTFTANVQDSAGAGAAETYTIPVSVPTGANCNNITFNVAGSTNPMVALSDLGAGTYLASQGGLYGNGSNTRPGSNDADGVALANSILPLDSNGNPEPVNGKIVLLSIGTSDAQFAFGQFLITANADPAKNPQLVIINGAQGGESAMKVADPASYYWSTIINFFLPQSGVNANQVVAAWVDAEDGNPTGVFPGDITALQSELESVAQNLHTKFPNLKLAYFSPMFYAGYSNGISTTNPEPYAYESAFAVRGAILDQINGSAMLNYSASNGVVMAPWMTWGPYMWANGMLARTDGLLWTCQDFQSDGVHPSSPGGRLRAASMLLDFFKTNDTTMPWFLAH